MHPRSRKWSVLLRVGIFRNRRGVFFCDDIFVVLSFMRPRSTHCVVLTQIHRFWMMCELQGFRAYIRWIKSRHNPADGPSRFLVKHAGSTKTALQRREGHSMPNPRKESRILALATQCQENSADIANWKQSRFSRRQRRLSRA